MSLIEPVEGMPKKRRKLNKEMEAEMAAAKRKIELVGALINDIRDEDIQGGTSAPSRKSAALW